jgi:hypothetical protein
MVVPPPFGDICRPGDRYQLVFAGKAKAARKTSELRHLCNDPIITHGILANTAATFPQQRAAELRRSTESTGNARNQACRICVVSARAAAARSSMRTADEAGGAALLFRVLQ